MERFILKKLLAWKDSPYRKPLILKGVRQVGKVNFMQIDPMTFTEFLLANNGDENLAQQLAQLAPAAFGEGNRLFTEFKGALTENFVLQTLITQFEVMPRYWSRNNPLFMADQADRLIGLVLEQLRKQNLLKFYI